MRIVFEMSPTILNSSDKALENSYIEKWKYKVMWHLKQLESELKNEDGLIVIPAIDVDKKIEIVGFSKVMGVKIYNILKPVCYPSE